MLSRFTRASLARPRVQHSVARLARASSSVPRLAQAATATVEATNNESTTSAELLTIQVLSNAPVAPMKKEVPAQKLVETPAQDSTIRPVAPANHPAQSVADSATTSASAADLPPVGQHDEFWRKVPVWEDVSASEFLSYRWGVSTQTHTLEANRPPLPCLVLQS